MGTLIRIIRPTIYKPWISPKWNPWVTLALILFVIVPCLAFILYRV